VLSRSDPFGMGKRSDHADGAVTAHAEVSDVIEEDDSGGAALVEGFAEERSDDHVRSARFIHYSGPEIVVVAAKALAALGERAAAEVRASAEYEASGLSGSVRVDDGDAACR